MKSTQQTEMHKDAAETGDLQALLAQVGAALDQFLRFEHADPVRTSHEWRPRLDTDLPLQGIGIEQVTDELITYLIPNGSPVAKPGFTSFITTGGTTASTLASTAASIAAPQRYLLTAFNFLEELSLDWLASMCSIGHLQGVYSSGGSVANLLALGAARQHAFEKVGHDPAAAGVHGRVRVYATREAHHTIQRAAGVLGIGRRAVRPIACDAGGRMEVADLRRAIVEDRQAGGIPMAIVANAGTTNTGAIDPLLAISEVAKEHEIWLHIDGAYGLPGILDRSEDASLPGLRACRLGHRRPS